MTEHTANNGATTVVRKHRQEGPRNHFLVFALSLLLTGFSFLAVAYSIAEEVYIEKWFVYMFIVFLGLFQAVVQLAFWMHMKDKGHRWETVFIAMGFIVALTVIISALFWIWW